MKFSLSQFSFLALFAVCSSVCSAVSFEFTPLVSTPITINGASDQIAFPTNASGYGFQIGNSSLPSLNNYFGSISGTFMIDAGSISSPSFGIQNALVTGSGLFNIFEVGSTTAKLTADLTLLTASTLNFPPFSGSSGSLNTLSAINLTNFQYTGGDLALQALLAGSVTGSAVISFQFIPGKSLTDLTDNSAANSATTFSGSVLTQIPEPSTYAAGVAALSLLVVFLRRRSTAAF
jgi:hypothetical protein